MAATVALSGIERPAAVEETEDGYAIDFDRPLTIPTGHILRVTIE
jgi:hypothetical protein